MKFAFVAKKDQEAATIKNYLINNLQGVLDEANPDFVFTIGGDGTVLDAVRKYLDKLDKIVFVTIHTGKLGFYTEFLPNEIENIKEILKDYQAREYHLIKCQSAENINYALNEITITDQHRLFSGTIFIDDKHLMKVRGNGLCVSTPTGSTAYNKSLGGAILMPHLEAFQLTVIAPFESLNYKMISPLLLNKEQTITIKPKNKYIDITADRNWISMEDVEEIKITFAEKKVKFLKNEKNDFVTRLNKTFIGD